MKYFLKSALFFTSLIFRKIKVDVIFYYPHHFNRGKRGGNLYFLDMINTCRVNDISFLVFEEPDYNSKHKRGIENIPFDFVFMLIILFRKLYGKEAEGIIKDQKIGCFLNSVFLRRLCFNNMITISQSMVSFFRGLNPKCKIFDVQHGIIHNNKSHYILNNKAESSLLDNDVHLLLNGQSFKNILLENDRSTYFKYHATVIGGHIQKSRLNHSKFNNNILITLQFTSDHDKDTNKLLYNYLEKFITSSTKDVNFYLKHHPRFNNEIDLSNLFELCNVYSTPEDINECFQLCSLHATAYSTSTFEAALYGIPTILINPLKRFNYFNIDFQYPFQYSVDDFKDKRLYQKCSKIVMAWASDYYSQYNEQEFLNLLK